jgi:putative chitinase
MTQFIIDRDCLKRLWPHASDAMLDGVASTSARVFAKYQLNTPLRVAHFMAQISHESDGGRIKEENMSYTTPERIAAVWPKRFTVSSAKPYVRNPQGLANKVYNGRMGNQPGSNDGFSFRGRGLLQLTGRASYQRIGKLTGLDLLSNPSLVSSPQHALEIAACEFRDLNCLPPADKDDIRMVTLRVNGGYIGIDSRRNWLTRWKLAIPSLPGSLPKTPEGEKEIEDQKMPRNADGDTSEAKPLEKSKTIWGGVISSLGGVFGTLFGAFQYIATPWGFAALVFIVAVIAFGLFMVIKGRIDSQTLIKQLMGDRADA